MALTTNTTGDAEPVLSKAGSLAFTKRSGHLLEDVERMLDYATATGIPIDSAMQADISTLLGDRSNAEPAAGELAADSSVSHASNENMKFELLLRVHGGLCNVVSPATPISLEATERAPGGWLIKNNMITLLVKLTIGSLLLMLLMSPAQVSRTTTSSTPETEVQESATSTPEPASTPENGGS